MPRDGVEREFKTMLADGVERERLIALIGGSPRVFSQRNILFDTGDRRLAAAGLSLRLRNENGLWGLTGKGALRTGRDDAPSLLIQRGEVERPLPEALAGHLAAGAIDPLPLLRRAEPIAAAARLADAMEAAAAGAPVVVAGEFRNERTVLDATLSCGTPVALALDRSEMPDGTVEHELELEVARAEIEAAAAWLAQLLDRARIPLRPAASKRVRFSRALDRREPTLRRA